MAKIAFILLCHKDPKAIIDQAQRLTAAGDYIAIHFDARSPRAEYEMIRAALADNASVTFAKKRVKCGWGEWSLVEGTLRAVEAALEAFPRATHFYMVSGDCMAIKSAEYAHEFLDAHDVDYVESFDFFESDWIKTGLREDRLIWRHWFNERSHKGLFYASMNLQKRLGLEREPPADIQVMIGSQWWCLRRRTIERIMDFVRERRDVVRFFSTTWIPDETFFQTLVRHLVPDAEIMSRTLTFLMFTDYGMPVTFYNDHYDMLLSQDYLFARKISPDAHELKRRLGALYASDRTDFKISNEGRSLFEFLTERGRIGQRFGERFWESEATLGRDRELLIVVAKKWHVGKRLLQLVREKTNIPAIDYLFDEEGTPLPDLGGIQASIEKRTRHRRALMRMLFDYYQTDRLAIGMDPGDLELMRDFDTDRSRTRFLEIETEFSDDWILGHALRVGLAGETTPQDAIDRLVPTIRQDFFYESDRIRDEGFADLHVLRENASAEERAQALAKFLTIPEERAVDIATTEDFFSD